MRDQTWLVVGVASVGAVLGLMVGASATPVVSVAVPTLFALAAAAIGLVQTSQINKEVAETIKALGDRTKRSPELVTLRAQLRAAPRRLGLILVSFSLAYLLSIVVGAMARTNNWLVIDTKPPPLPWKEGGKAPPDLESALEWIVVQHQLKSLGYDDDSVARIYATQVAEWQRASGHGERPRSTTRPAVTGKLYVAPAQSPKTSSSAPSNPASMAKGAETNNSESTLPAYPLDDDGPMPPPSAPRKPGITDILPKVDTPAGPALAFPPKLEEERRKTLDRTS